jgi:DNA polymerase elongation subunit (family B)
MSELVFDIETEPDEVSQKLESELVGKIEPTKTAIKEGLDAVRKYIDGKMQDVRSDYALSPMTGKVKCICGILDDEEFSISGDEKYIIETFLSKFTGQRLISFNGKGFDNPFLKIRMAKLDIKPIFLTLLPNRKYDTHEHFDVKEVLDNFSSAPKKGNLRQWSVFFGLQAPENDGNEISELTIEQTIEKCLQDCRNTKAIYDKIKWYY